MPKSKKKSVRKLREEDRQRKQNFPPASVDCCSQDDSSVLHSCNTATPSNVDSSSASKVPFEAEFPALHEESFHGLHPDSVLLGSIEIQVLDYYSQLLRTQSGLTYGLIPPSAVYQLQTSKEMKSLAQVVPRNSTSVQIHFIDSHYVVSARKGSVLSIFDSLENNNRIHSLMPQLQIVYGDVTKYTLNYVVPQSQGATVDCGAFAAANAYFLVKGVNPRDITIEQRTIRTHLKLCLETGVISDFPYQNKLMSTLLSDYFRDQTLKTTHKQRQVTITRTTLPLNSTITVKNSLKQKKWRNKQKQENPELFKHKETVRKQKTREKHISVDPIAAKNKRAIQQKQTRDKLTIADPVAAKKKRANEQKQARQKLTCADSVAAKMKRAIQQKQRRDKLTIADPVAAKKKRANEQEQARQKLTCADSVAAKMKRAIQQKQRRDKLTIADPVAAKKKRANEQKQARQKLTCADSVAAKMKRAIQQKQRGDKLTIADPVAAKKKRANEQKQARQKLTCADSVAAKMKRAIQLKLRRDKLTIADPVAAKKKRANEQKQARQKLTCADSVAAKMKRAKQQKQRRDKLTIADPVAAKKKRANEQKQARQKLTCADSVAAKMKMANQQKQTRDKLTCADPVAAKRKRANEQKQTRQKLTCADPLAAKMKRAIQQKQTRDKLICADPVAAKEKRANEQKLARQKLTCADPVAAKMKRANEQKQTRQKLISADPVAAKIKRAKEQKRSRQKLINADPVAAKLKMAKGKEKTRQKLLSADPIAAKTKRAKEQKQARQKLINADPVSAKTKRAKEQKQARQKLITADPIAAKKKRAKEKQQAREKLATTNSVKAKQKRAVEQQTHREKQKRNLNFSDASKHFLNDIYQFPEFVCTCCSRMLYKKTVVSVHSVSLKEAERKFLNNCLSHPLSTDGTEWLCKTCLRYIKQKKVPPQSDKNNLKIPRTPEELQDLTSLEERLLAQRYPFMKLIALPKGRQSAIKGAVVNIPVEVDTVVQSLPRTPNQAGFLPLKLKRKIEYNGHYTFQYIRPDRVMNALHWLKVNNPLYKEIQLKDTWQQDCLNEDTDTWNEMTGNVSEDDTTDTESLLSSDNVSSGDNETDTDSLDEIVPITPTVSNSVHFDTCVQPSDPTIDASRILSIAPGEGKKPVKILEDKQFEELSFPSLFPSGTFGYTYERPVKLSAKKYFQRRILEKGGKFAANIEYLFVAQFITEWQQILSSMSVALRKSLSGNCGENYSAGFFKNADHIRPLLTKDDAYRFLNPIRGSPPYWQKVMSELMAAIKQFQIFTWFLTLSAADMRWEDTLTAIARQEGRKLTPEQVQEMTWEERSRLLRSNPATAARHFHHKVQALFTNILLSPANTLGKITRYFYRIEFQQRGSPHVHAILWVEDAPKPSDDSEKICNFVEQYVKADLPNEDEELLNLVESLQTHTHTATCKKKGGTCRFGYPKPISDHIILSRPDPDHDDPKKRRAAIQLLTQVKEFLDDETTVKDNLITTDVLEKCAVSQDLYYEALKSATKTETIFLPRCPNETCINNYNSDILRLWKANMDLQYVTSPYAAIAYITSYITKDEREVGAVLQAVSKEMKSLNIKEQMKKAAFSFANARNVSAQEAAYRILGLPLYVSNFTTVWIPSGFPAKRIRIMKPNQFLQSLDDDDENIFCTNIIDRYSARPAQLEHMCLAEFAMWYSVQSKNTSQDEPDTDPSPPTIEIPQTTESYEGSSETPEPVDRLHSVQSKNTSQDEPDTDQSPPTIEIPQTTESYEGSSETPEPVDRLHSVQSKNTSQDEPDTDKSPPAIEIPHTTDSNEGFSEISTPIDSLHTNPNNQIVITRYGKMKRRSSPAVIRYHQCSQSKDPELYSYNRMLLFMPWKDEKTDLLGKFPTYTEHYESRKDQIEDTFSTLMKFEDIVEQAITQNQEQGPPQHAWDQIAPETEHTEADLIEEGYVSDENFAILNPDVNPTAVFTGTHHESSTIPVSAVELIPELLDDIDYRKLVQSLNFEQRCVYQSVLEWCHKIHLPTDNSVEPLHIFVTGGAGTGKSHLIKAIHNMVCRELTIPGNEPSKPTILLMAPTGTAAFNIGGCTVHSSFLLPTKMGEVYRKLSDSTCNQLRVQLCQLKVVVIDEISMVSLKALNYTDKRLQQIKDSSLPFGGISVIAVGDLYQLRPIGKYVFENFSDVLQNLAGMTWQELFSIFELKQIMRQKDDIEFASLLNRIRTGQHTPADIQILQARNIDPTDPQYNQEALHIFSRNVRTNTHNNNRLRELQQPIVTLTRRERRPAALRDFVVPDNPTHTGGISKTIELCKQARVMVIRNIDVKDGLVNGAQGTIVDFLPNSNQVQTILVKFDKDTVGQAARQSFQVDLSPYPHNVIPIKRVDVSFSPTPNKPGPEITWTQFPLRLSFSCTIHKVQGLSVDQLVVSFEDPFQGGQAYVALSRCTTLQGMQLLQFDPAKIKTCKLVQKEMDRLRLHKNLPNPYNVLQEPVSCYTLSVSLLNGRSLTLHFQDVSTDPITHMSDVLMFTETHLYERQTAVHTIPVFDSLIYQPDSNKKHHGLACYYKNTLQCQLVQLLQLHYIEALRVSIASTTTPLTMILIYRSPSVNWTKFRVDLTSLLDSLHDIQSTIILGDFNEDALSPDHQRTTTLLGRYGFIMTLSERTHKLGACLDHIYLSPDISRRYNSCSFHPVYYSDHYYGNLNLQWD